MECFKCHSLRNFQYECSKWNKESNYIKLGEEEELLLMDLVEENKIKRNDAWFLDSRCSNYIHGDKEMFSNVVKEHNHYVKYGNKSRMFVVEKDNVRLVINDTTFLI